MRQTREASYYEQQSRLLELTINALNQSLRFLGISAEINQENRIQLDYYEIQGKDKKYLYSSTDSSIDLKNEKGDIIHIINSGVSIDETICPCIVVEQKKYIHRLDIINSKDGRVLGIKTCTYSKGQDIPECSFSMFEYSPKNICIYYEQRDDKKRRRVGFKQDIRNGLVFEIKCDYHEGFCNRYNSNESSLPGISIRYNNLSNVFKGTVKVPSREEIECSLQKAIYSSNEVLSHHRTQDLMNKIDARYDIIFPGLSMFAEKKLPNVFKQRCAQYKISSDEKLSDYLDDIINPNCDLDDNGFARITKRRLFDS